MKRILLLALICASCRREGPITTPEGRTRLFIQQLFVRINFYTETNKEVPPSLAALPPAGMNMTNDAWGRPIQYRINTNSTITLLSFGRDGKPGGQGEDADIAQTYRLKHRDGSLWVGSPGWVPEAELK
jgi:hypothetical protein